MPGKVLADLCKHTGTIQQAVVSTTATPTRDPQGGLATSISFTTPAASTSITLRLMPVSPMQIAELTAQAGANAVVPTWKAFIPYTDAPAALIDFDASPHPSQTHRLVNVYEGATLLHAGPFNIMHITDAGSEGEFVTLLMRTES